jgi:hypothetical protein
MEHLSATWALPLLLLSPNGDDVSRARQRMCRYYRAGIGGLVARDAESACRRSQRVDEGQAARTVRIIVTAVVVGAVIGSAHSPTAAVAAHDDGDDPVVPGRTAEAGIRTTRCRCA